MKNKIECNKWIFTKLDLDEISIIKNILNNDEYVNINISKNNNDFDYTKTSLKLSVNLLNLFILNK